MTIKAKTFTGTCEKCRKPFNKKRATGASRWNHDAKTPEEMTAYQKWCHENKHLCEECETPYRDTKCEGYKIDYCGHKVKMDGLCGRCYSKKWREENPEKYKAQKERRNKKLQRKTLTLDFGTTIGRSPKEHKIRKGIYEDLERVAKEEMRPISTQAIYFIAQGIERYNRRKSLVESFFDDTENEEPVIEEELEEDDMPDLVDELESGEYGKEDYDQ